MSHLCGGIPGRLGSFHAGCKGMSIYMYRWFDWALLPSLIKNCIDILDGVNNKYMFKSGTVEKIQ